jgi:hypothetical protein
MLNQLETTKHANQRKAAKKITSYIHQNTKHTNEISQVIINTQKPWCWRIHTFN